MSSRGSDQTKCKDLYSFSPLFLSLQACRTRKSRDYLADTRKYHFERYQIFSLADNICKFSFTISLWRFFSFLSSSLHPVEKMQGQFIVAVLWESSQEIVLLVQLRTKCCWNLFITHFWFVSYHFLLMQFRNIKGTLWAGKSRHPAGKQAISALLSI